MKQITEVFLKGENPTLIVKKLLERYMKTNCKKTNQKEYRIEKVIKRKLNKLNVQCFNSWIDKTRHCIN